MSVVVADENIIHSFGIGNLVSVVITVDVWLQSRPEEETSRNWFIEDATTA